MQSFLLSEYTQELHQANQLDPLELGPRLTESLPEINQHQALPDLLEIGTVAVEAAHDVEFSQDPRLAIAALRDIDFLAGSLVRMGSSIHTIDGLSQTMEGLGAIAQTVPRGTVYTYSVQNPSDQERTFTDTLEEHFFIKTVREAGELMLSECESLLSLNPETDDAHDIADSLAHTADGMKFVVKGMVEVSRVVSPSFFTTTLRPYFDSLEIDGVHYAGAGGAQLPLVVIDRIMWGEDSGSMVYHDYFKDTVRYQPAMIRQDMAKKSREQDGTSLISRLRERHHAGEDMTPAIDEATSVMQQVKRFRMPHRRVAQDNFKLRSSNAVGSGQYTPSILDTLVDLTDNALEELADLKSTVGVFV